MALLHLTHVSVSAEWYSSVAQMRSTLQPERSARGVEPGSHGVQEVEELEPGSETLLESHAVQVMMLVAAVAPENFPATQSMHEVAAGVSENFPESQSLHVATLVAAVIPENFPEAQLVHVEKPAPEYVPEAQSVHETAAAPEYVPALQSSQAAMLVAAVAPEYFPATQ
jgi:hypothetical protein